jgi:hypothetical protein
MVNYRIVRASTASNGFRILDLLWRSYGSEFEEHILYDLLPPT